MPVQKKSLIGNTVKKTQTASQEPQQANDLKANSLAAHSMKKKKFTITHLRTASPALTMRRMKKA